MVLVPPASIPRTCMRSAASYPSRADAPAMTAGDERGILAARERAMGETRWIPRRHERVAPAHAVQVTAELEGALALGEAVDLSAGGACVALPSRALGVGDEVIL